VQHGCCFGAEIELLQRRKLVDPRGEDLLGVLFVIEPVPVIKFDDGEAVPYGAQKLVDCTGQVYLGGRIAVALGWPFSPEANCLSC
jgi:hypothetical protein